VYDIIDIRMLTKHLIQSCFVGDVYIVVNGTLPGDEFDAIDAFFRGIVEIVDDDDLVFCLEKSECSEGADVASASARFSLRLTHLWQSMINSEYSSPCDKDRSYSHLDCQNSMVCFDCDFVGGFTSSDLGVF
jgi:hypothetical protein